MMTTGSTYAVGQPLTCYPIRRGDTAASLAQRFTGNASNRHDRGFQVFNRTTATFIPKSRYGVIQAGWEVCVATEILRRGLTQSGSVAFAAPQPGVAAQQTESRNLSVLWWAVPPFVALSGLVIAWAWKHIDERRARLHIMRRFGDRFISEFERPLFRSAADRPVKSRVRFVPARHKVEILLAPAAGRTYPNLVDHRKNVEYDVARVLRLLKDEPFINGPLYAEGPWVVIPCHFEIDK
jgi:hypothetical protein